MTGLAETFTALLLAHVIADFLLQSGWMVAGKAAQRPAAHLAHIGVVLAAAAVVLLPATADGLPAWLATLALLTALHLATDIAKGFAGPGLGPFLADQAAHFAALVVIALWQPQLWSATPWAGQDWLLPAMALLSGLILATRAGGFAVGMLMAPYATGDLPAGLPDGGKVIGLLERGLIFGLVLVGQPAGIGFLIAAKSVLRFDTASKDTKAGEYVIIGTLASFGWALVIAYAARALAIHLGFPALVP